MRTRKADFSNPQIRTDTLILLHGVLCHLHALTITARRAWVYLFGGYGLFLFRLSDAFYQVGSDIFCEVCRRRGITPPW